MMKTDTSEGGDVVSVISDQSRSTESYQQVVLDVVARLGSCLLLDDLVQTLADLLAQYTELTEFSLLLQDTQGQRPGTRWDLTADGDLAFTLAHQLNPVTLSQPGGLRIDLRQHHLSLGSLFLPQLQDKPSLPPQQQAYLDLITGQLTVALQNANLYQQTQEQASQAFLLNQISQALRQSLEIPEILSTAVEEIAKLLGVSRCIISVSFQPLNPVSLLPASIEATPTPGSEVTLYQYQLPGIPAFEPTPNDLEPFHQELLQQSITAGKDHRERLVLCVFLRTATLPTPRRAGVKRKRTVAHTQRV
jgi:K+-sensing histidine kinase KdpD